eukprot:186475-Prymnesium_polylepis.1
MPLASRSRLAASRLASHRGLTSSSRPCAPSLNPVPVAGAVPCPLVGRQHGGTHAEHSCLFWTLRGMDSDDRTRRQHRHACRVACGLNTLHRLRQWWTSRCILSFRIGTPHVVPSRSP